jgi:hypothetical protein
MNNFDSNHWWGVAAAIGCGLGVRYFPQVVGAGGAGGVAAVVAVCLLMLVDAGDVTSP